MDGFVKYVCYREADKRGAPFNNFDWDFIISFCILGFFRALIMFSTSLVDVYLNRILRYYEVSRLLSSTDESFPICVLLDLRVVFSRLSTTVRK